MNELRKDPILNRWVAVMKESKPLEFYHSLIPCKADEKQSKVTSCPLCAGRESETPQEIFALRDNGSTPNTPGWKTRVIPWIGYVFQIEGELGRKAVGMYDRMNCVGANEIVIETPNHNEHPEEAGLKQMADVIKTYKARLIDLEKDHRLRYSFVYKDYDYHSSEFIGHAHSKIICPPIIPKGIKDELEGARQFYYYKERCIFCDIITEELNSGKRVLMETRDFVAFIPYAPKVPFESWILPKRHDCAFENITDQEIEDLSLILSTVIKKIKTAFPNTSYYYVFHSAPNRMPRKDYWHTIGEDYHWHIEIVPKVKIMAGFEVESDFYILHTSPEDAAKILKEVR